MWFDHHKAHCMSAAGSTGHGFTYGRSDTSTTIVDPESYQDNIGTVDMDTQLPNPKVHTDKISDSYMFCVRNKTILMF